MKLINLANERLVLDTMFINYVIIIVWTQSLQNQLIDS